MTREKQLIYDALCDVLFIAKKNGGFYECNYSVEEIENLADRISKESDDMIEAATEFAETYRTTGETTWEEDLKISFLCGAEWRDGQLSANGQNKNG